jgi:hypothetical protein
MKDRAGVYLVMLFLIILILIFFGDADSRDSSVELTEKQADGPSMVPVTDGSNVHDVGELHTHVGNWGIFGSMPTTTLPFAFAPSAEWPAGSGIEHLYISGLWVGAIKSGLPAVSTAAYHFEFQPTDSPIDIIYRSFEGNAGGDRLPSVTADDDGDGMIDEDWLDGRDNDMDGMIDEDYAAISDQMFSCWFTDDQPLALELYPEHDPLNIMVRQESYQWADYRFRDFIGVRYIITNVGTETLENIYIGFFADCDVGSRYVTGYGDDDATGSYFGNEPTEFGPADVMMAYAYDADGDGGATRSYFGAQLLGYSTDTLGVNFPATVGISGIQFFSGGVIPYEYGGDPANDFERYDALSQASIDRGLTGGDVRLLINTGPYQYLAPGMTIEVHVALVAGYNVDDLAQNAAYAKRFYEGTWFDLDGDPQNGKETQVHWYLEDLLPSQVDVELDIKPGSCPNPFNVKLFDYVDSGQENKGGVLPVAILGSEEFDVGDIDIESVQLEGVTPLETGLGYEDVSAPDGSTEECYCEELGPDGYIDLVMKFSSLEIAEAIMPAGEAGEERALSLTGRLVGGAMFEATDCVVFVGKASREKVIEEEPKLFPASPNPFNPITRVSYYLPERQRIRLSVYDVSGSLIAVIDDGVRGAGEHTVEWNARGVASGVYFSRLEAGVYTRTQKMILLR